MLIVSPDFQLDVLDKILHVDMSSGTTQFGCPWGNIPCKCPERTSRRGVLEVSQTPYRYTQTTARPDIVCRSSTSTHILRRRHWRNIQTIHRNTTTAFNVYRHATSIEYCHSSTLSRLPCVAFRLYVFGLIH